jgi:hypothetical protein
VIIASQGKILLSELIKKRSSYYERNEIVRLEIEIVIFEIVFKPRTTIQRNPKNTLLPMNGSNSIRQWLIREWEGCNKTFD